MSARLRERLRALRFRTAGHTRRALPGAFWEPLRGARALELGGPSTVFAAGGLLPAYPVLERIDGVQFSAETIWHGTMGAGCYMLPDGTAKGRLWILDASDLRAIAGASYDAVLSSHVIEHLANPLRALAEWRRVVRPGGHLLMVAPHLEGTFDHRRPVTPLAHLVEDERRGTGEDDLTHLEETLALHDFSRDVSDPATHAAWCRDNLAHRTMHHHTFTTPSLLALLDRAGLVLLAAEARWPHDIYVLARFPAAGAPPPDNARFLGSRAPAVRRSAFRSDSRDHRELLRAIAWRRAAAGPGA
jgi:SAM-dependent methyltransferase